MYDNCTSGILFLDENGDKNLHFDDSNKHSQFQSKFCAPSLDVYYAVAN